MAKNRELTFLTENSFVSLKASAFEWHSTAALLAAGKWNASIAVVAIVSNFAAAFAWSLTVAVHRVTIALADRNVTQIPLPACAKNIKLLGLKFLSN